LFKPVSGLSSYEVNIHSSRTSAVFIAKMITNYPTVPTIQKHKNIAFSLSELGPTFCAFEWYPV
jgi:hypothetical protein